MGFLVNVVIENSNSVFRELSVTAIYKYLHLIYVICNIGIKNLKNKGTDQVSVENKYK